MSFSRVIISIVLVITALILLLSSKVNFGDGFGVLFGISFMVLLFVFAVINEEPISNKEKKEIDKEKRRIDEARQKKYDPKTGKWVDNP